MELKINNTNRLRRWTRIEKYQNSTLRYPPKGDFPPLWQEVIGRPKIIRCTIKMDDVWDYRTDEYFWDYEIGRNRYKDDLSKITHDRGEFEYSESPRGVSYTEYLTSYTQYADETNFMFRRYERAVVEGHISVEKYGEVLETILEHYKELCPNIKYIEINEPNCPSFGELTMFEFYPLYKCLYTAVNHLNEKHDYDIPLLAGGPCIAGGVDCWHEWEEFMRLYQLDKDPKKRIDFYVFHDYERDVWREETFYRKHMELIQKMGMPDLPIFLNEYGVFLPTPDDFDSLVNASGTLAGMLLESSHENLFIFPWCTFHDPVIQHSHTHFIRDEEGNYIPTPCGHAMKALSMLDGEELDLGEKARGKAVAVTDGKKIRVLVTNYGEQQEAVNLKFENLPFRSLQVTEYRVDKTHNNYFTDASHRAFEITNKEVVPVGNETAAFTTELSPYSFALWEFEGKI